MSTNKNTSFLSSIFYGLKAGIFALSIMFGLSWVIFQILDNYSSKFSFTQQYKNHTIYILRSNTTIKEYESYKIGKQSYLDRLSLLAKKFQESDYNVQLIEEGKLATLQSDDILIVFDAVHLRKADLENIKTFTKKGGFLLFNYNFASIINGVYVGSKNIQKISSLKKIAKPYDVKEHGLFIVNRLLTPLNLHNNHGKRIDFRPYDALNLYSSKEIKPDIFLTNWELTQASEVDKNYPLTVAEAGVAWHGSYGKGNWVYFSFPSYVFFEGKSFENYFMQIFSSIFSYANNKLSIQVFPYLDKYKAVLVSEDTEYKFAQVDAFAHLAEKYSFPVTAFCVSNLAQKHSALIKKIAANKFIEIASHGATHEKILSAPQETMLHEIRDSKNILEALSKKTVIGFRPPREELDVNMSKIITQSGYRYILNNVTDSIYPTFKDNYYHIPRLGTDDYNFIVKKYSDSEAILQAIKQETQFVTGIDGIYNLDIHTHLLGYEKNINIIEKYFSYINADKNLEPLNAKEIVSRLEKVKNIEISSEVTPKNYLITVKNLNNVAVKNYHFRLYWPHDKSIKAIHSEIVGADVSFVSNARRRFSDVNIAQLAPRSPMTLIINYEALR